MTNPTPDQPDAGKKVEPMSDERCAGHERFAAAVKQSCEHWHRARGKSPETLASDNTYDLACRLLEATTEIRRLKSAKIQSLDAWQEQRYCLRRRIAELKDANHDLAITPTTVILDHNRTIELLKAEISTLRTTWTPPEDDGE